MVGHILGRRDGRVEWGGGGEDDQVVQRECHQTSITHKSGTEMKKNLKRK